MNFLLGIFLGNLFAIIITRFIAKRHKRNYKYDKEE